MRGVGGMRDMGGILTNVWKVENATERTQFISALVEGMRRSRDHPPSPSLDVGTPKAPREIRDKRPSRRDGYGCLTKAWEVDGWFGPIGVQVVSRGAKAPVACRANTCTELADRELSRAEAGCCRHDFFKL